MPNLSHEVRSVLENSPDALTLPEVLGLIDAFVLECSSTSKSQSSLPKFEDELQSIYHEVIDYSLLHQTEVFLAILHRLDPILPPTSIISWFDLILRPALREPKLPTQSVNYARDLVVSALQKKQNNHAELVGGFRRRLMELYLLDAFNESSGNDILEWAELDEDQRDKRTFWKLNLEDILVRYGNEQPEALFTEIHTHFAIPTARLQLLSLLNLYTSTESFPSAALILAKHQLMLSLMYSLFLDKSSTLCTTTLTLVVKLLPFFAVHARNELRVMLPKLLAIMARLLCWKGPPPSIPPDAAETQIDIEFERELEFETNPVLHVRPDLDWPRLDRTFSGMKSLPPSSRPYFTALYYLYPSNVIKFFRGPIQYLADCSLESPYAESWEQALDEDEIRRKSENLLREHVCHPLLVWRDAVHELSDPEFWSRYGISRIVSEMVLLDVRNNAIGLRARYGASKQAPSADIKSIEPGKEENGDVSGHTIHSIELTSQKTIISLQEMINTSVALKSNLDVEVTKPESQWPQELLSRSTSPQKSNLSISESITLDLDEGMNAMHVTQAISGLQREVLLLRNELNFELWLSRENVKHIGRLYQDRILMKTAEAERQGLYNKLRKYRAQVLSLENELREHKQQAYSAKNKYADWNTELQKKLKELREEKKSWISEAAALRSAEKESQALAAAQAKLLGEASNQVFQLQTEKKEYQHKIDRLKDYEAQIAQHMKIQRLWDEDFARFNARAEEIKEIRSQFKQMQLRLHSLEQHGQERVNEAVNAYRSQIKALEKELIQVKKIAEKKKRLPEQEIAAFSSEKAAWKEAKKTLEEENLELKDEIEEMRAMVELLRGQISGQGLVSEPKSSPISLFQPTSS